MTRSVFTEKYKYVRDFLAAARNKKNYSQRELSQKLNMATSFVNKYENGERCLDIVETIEILKFLEADIPTFIKNLQELKTDEIIIGKKPFFPEHDKNLSLPVIFGLGRIKINLKKNAARLSSVFYNPIVILGLDPRIQVSIPAYLQISSYKSRHSGLIVSIKSFFQFLL